MRTPDSETIDAAALAAARRRLNDMIAVRAYEEGRGPAEHRPVDLFMQVASACNLDCYMCSEHNRPPEWRRGRGATSLPPELFERVERELFPHARRLTIGVGGEPMISPHFLDYVRRTHAAGLELHVMSNGTRIRSDEAAETLARCTTSMEISVDASTPETYERIRLGSKWGSLIKNLERLVAARDALPEGERVHLTLCFVLMKSNAHEFVDFVDFGKRIGADRVAGWHVIPVTEEGKDESLQDDRARSNEILARALERGRELGIEVDAPKPFDLDADDAAPVSSSEAAAQVPEQVAVALAATPVVAPAAEAPPPTDDVDEHGEFVVVDHPVAQAPPPTPAADAVRERRTPGFEREYQRHTADIGRVHCASPTTSVFLFYDGRVLPCCHPHAHAQMPMGNLWNESFEEIWNGPLYRNLRAGLFKGDVPPLCQSCSIVHSPPPRREDLDEILAEGNDLRSWYGGRELEGANADDERWADDRKLERLAHVESALEQTRAHAATIEAERDALAGHAATMEAERDALEGHVTNLEKILSKIHGRAIYAFGSRIKDIFVPPKDKSARDDG